MSLSSDVPYSLFDRVLHKLAFDSVALQDILSDIEHSLYGREWESVELGRSIFVTSLPRAGTTILLEALHRLPGTASHTYRDMPFLFSPFLWERLSGRLRKRGVLRERAHGDQLYISEDSPEAFEEVLWKKYFPQQFQFDGIQLLSHEVDEFRRHFIDHFKKIALLRNPSASGKLSYISKNNGNISRIPIIRRFFPDSIIVILLRDPLSHAISLWKQHLNFETQHEHNAFAQRYMSDIGHYEFGANHRPILFPGMEKVNDLYSPDELDYWLFYWICAFRHLQEQESVTFVSYERLCQSGSTQLNVLLKLSEIECKPLDVEDAASVFRSAPPLHAGDSFDVSVELRSCALDIYEKLLLRTM